MTRNAPNDRSGVRRARLGGFAPLFVLLAVFALSLSVRLHQLDAFITPDEMKWVCRSINFYRGLGAGNLARTLQTGHPGVITMWLGVPFSRVDLEAPWLDACANPSLSDIIEESPPFVPVELAAYLFRARRGVALFTCLALALSIWLLSRLADWRTAIGAGVLIALDPFYVAHSRFLHLDAITTSLLFPAVLALLVGLETSKRRYHVLSGVLLALATLNKSPALFGIGFAGLVTVLWGVRYRYRLGWHVRTIATWALPALLTYIAAWPAMWVTPVHTVRQVLGTALFYASRPHVNSNYYFGAPRPDPGWSFYAIALLFRLTPWSLVAAVAGFGAWVSRRRIAWPGVAALFVVLYAVFMTLGQKKFDRYLLPTFPFVQALAAYGFVWLTDAGLRRVAGTQLRALGAAILPVCVPLLAGATVLGEAPYYLTYYNPLAGGKRAAAHALLVGWGEGLDQAAAYLDTLPEAAQRSVASRALPGFAPFYVGPTHHQSSYDPATTDYVIFYVNELQRRLEPELMAEYYERVSPLYVAQAKGLDYVWVYRNDVHQRVLQAIEKASAPDDAIVVSRPAILQREYRGPLSLYTLDLAGPRDATLSLLQQIAETHRRAWYVAYDAKNPDPRLEWMSFLWKTHARTLESHDIGPATVSLFEIDERTSYVGANGPQIDVNLSFAGELLLRGYALQAGEADPARSHGITLEWQVLKAPTRYYACYVHVLDEGGRVVGQGDHWMSDSSLRPTVDWRAGDVVYEEVALELTPGIAPGEYTLELGVYDRTSEEAASIRDARSGTEMASARVGSIAVGPTTGDFAFPEEMAMLSPAPRLTPGLALLGYSLSTPMPGFGEALGVALAWEGDSASNQSYSLRLEIIDAQGATVGSADYPLASTQYPTSRWPEGMRFWRIYDLAVSPDAVYGPASLRATVASGDRAVESVTIATLDIEGHRFAAPEIPHRQEASTEVGIRLLGFAVAPATLRAGEALELSLVWQATAPIPASYTVFTHLLDPAGLMRAQDDSLPMEGKYPTNRWQVGEFVVDRHTLSLQDDAPAGDYKIEIGLYDLALGAARVALYDAAGQRLPDDRMLLSLPIVVMR